MSRHTKSVPSYCLHKASGQAVVFIDRKAVYLGPYGTPESRRAYGELLSRLESDERAAKNGSFLPSSPVSVAELCLKFVTDELPRYSKAEQHCQISAIRILRQLFGETPVTEFGPLRLRILRDAMVEGATNVAKEDGYPSPRKPWSRRTVNRQVKRIQALFRWGVSWEMVPESVAASLGTVRTLAVGETSASEPSLRRPVPQEDIDTVRMALRPHHRDILDLLRLTGARSGEILSLRMKDIDRTGDVWRADLTKHKTAHKGKNRVLFFNATAQVILMRHTKADPNSKFFSCRRDNFGSAVRRACKRTGVTPFVPHQVRHAVATRLVDELGIEATQQLLGHSSSAMTRHYSRAAEKQAIEAAKKLG